MKMNRREFLQVAITAAAWQALPKPVRQAAATGEQPLYVALFDGVQEVSGGGYARAQIGADEIAAGNDITFATATADWGTITHAVIVDGAGQFLLPPIPLSQARSVVSGDIVGVEGVIEFHE